MYDTPIDLWIIHAKRKILLTDMPGVPVIVTSITPEAAERIKKDGTGPTVSEVQFPADVWHHFDNWDDARKKADELSKELGYKAYEESYYWGVFDEDPDYDEPEFDEDFDWDESEDN